MPPDSAANQEFTVQDLKMSNIIILTSLMYILQKILFYRK